MQSLKLEYGTKLAWIIPYPGDWHLLKNNYQHCLMKPFFETGLKDLASTCGYPTAFIQKCSHFQTTHRFLLEAWGSILRHILQSCIKHNSEGINEEFIHVLHELQNETYDRTAIGWAIQSQILHGIHAVYKEGKDDTWKFWIGFVQRFPPLHCTLHCH